MAKKTLDLKKMIFGKNITTVLVSMEFLLKEL